MSSLAPNVMPASEDGSGSPSCSLSWRKRLWWIPTSKAAIMASQTRLLSMLQSPYVQEQVEIGSGTLRDSPSSKLSCPATNEPRFINTVTFESTAKNAPTLVMVHGYGASLGFFFRNFDALVAHFRVIAIDQLGWGASSRPDFLCRSTEEHGQFSFKRKLSWYIFALARIIGPWGPDLVRKYTTVRFVTDTTGQTLDNDESKLLTDYVYHTLAAKASGELCLKYIFSFGAFARSPLLRRASDWKVPTSFIYGIDDWMDFNGGLDTCKAMKVPVEMFRVPRGGHFVFMENTEGFILALLHACRKYLSSDQVLPSLWEEGIIQVF